MTFHKPITVRAQWGRLARTGRVLAVLLAFGLAPSPALAVFASGGTGTNGAFPPAAVPGGTTSMLLSLLDGTVTFNPGGTTAQVPNTPAGGFVDGVLQFTSLNVPSGVSLSFIRNVSNTPVTFIVQTAALVDGTINMDGGTGGPGTGASATGAGGLAGPGGFRGGNGELIRGNGGAGAGLGPGGGVGGDVISPGAEGGVGSYATLGVGSVAGTGPLYGQPNLLPLVGGSGGGGATAGNSTGTARGAGGGGGGGAILIAATDSIRVDGAILVRGGVRGSGPAGSGSGGAIRLLSTLISGTGALDASGGVASSRDGGLGRIRLEADLQQFAGTLSGVSTASGPGLVMLPSTPTIAIAMVDGMAVPAIPGGAQGQVDVIVTSAGTKTIDLTAANVPLGTTISLTAKAEQDGPTVGPITSTALAGTLGNSTATVTLTFPKAGLFFLEARATFNVP